MNERVDEWMSGETEEWKSGWTDGRMNQRMDWRVQRVIGTVHALLYKSLRNLVNKNKTRTNVCILLECRSARLVGELMMQQKRVWIWRAFPVSWKNRRKAMMTDF